MADIMHEGNSGWSLRFLGGDVYGRLVTLRRGENVLGAAGEVDISVPGADVQPRHLVLNVGDVAVSAERVGDAAVEINGRPTTQRVFALAGLEVFELVVEVARGFAGDARVVAVGAGTPLLAVAVDAGLHALGQGVFKSGEGLSTGPRDVGGWPRSPALQRR